MLAKVLIALLIFWIFMKLKGLVSGFYNLIVFFFKFYLKHNEITKDEAIAIAEKVFEGDEDTTPYDTLNRRYKTIAELVGAKVEMDPEIPNTVGKQTVRNIVSMFWLR